MPRSARAVETHGTYHVTARGNRRSAIYVDDVDRAHFLRLLARVVERHGWKCLAYCLLTNHYHLLIWTVGSELAAGMRRLNGHYALDFNGRHELEGHVFQERFGSKLIRTQAHLLESIRYIALNPVRAGICARPERWPWSSYTVLARGDRGLSADAQVLELFANDEIRARQRLRSFVHEGDVGGWPRALRCD